MRAAPPDCTRCREFEHLTIIQMWKVRLGDEFTLAELSGPPAVTMKQVSPKWTKSALIKRFPSPNCCVPVTTRRVSKADRTLRSRIRQEFGLNIRPHDFLRDA
ncbi:MAG: hypothetical protein Rhob2KO_36050 [Rhodopirellula baltica]